MPLKAKESQVNIASAQEATDPDLSEQVLFEAIASDPEVGVREQENGKNCRSRLAKQLNEFESQISLVEKPAKACFSEATIDKAKDFFSHRKSKSFDRVRKRQAPVQSPPPEAGPTSKSGQSSGFETNGMAILDTGASRSVIGDINLPKLRSKLPEHVRSRVKERASRIAFRFGNNQIEYGYKQVHIPIEHKKIRMWSIIEVVPKGTPFLLSIQAMKSLGTAIDLQSNTCFLKSMNRSIELVEGRTGLLMIRIKDLCQSSKCQSIFGASSDSKAPWQTPEQDADSRRDAANGKEHGRECGAITPDSAHDSVESGGHSGINIKPRSSPGTSHDDGRTYDRGPVTEGKDRRAGQLDDESGTVAKSSRRGIHSADRERSGGMGPRGPSLSESTSSKGTSNAATLTSTSSDCTLQSRTVDGSRERKFPCPTIEEPRGWSCKHRWNSFSWNPITNEPFDLAWTTTAMEQWGQKRVTWRKKHPGKTYQAVYEADS